jgi:hypothetical protein
VTAMKIDKLMDRVEWFDSKSANVTTRTAISYIAREE